MLSKFAIKITDPKYIRGTDSEITKNRNYQYIRQTDSEVKVNLGNFGDICEFLVDSRKILWM